MPESASIIPVPAHVPPGVAANIIVGVPFKHMAGTELILASKTGSKDNVVVMILSQPLAAVTVSL